VITRSLGGSGLKVSVLVRQHAGTRGGAQAACWIQRMVMARQLLK